MSRSKRGSLSPEDSALWSKVARSVAPLKGRSWPETDEPMPEPVQSAALPAVVAEARGKAERLMRDSVPGGIDRPTRRKLAKGRLSLEAKIDLHGMTQAQAHGVLVAFLHRALGEGRRHVLVVTGKGSSLGSDGVLRRAVPAWFATPAFRGLVSGWEDAARGHGGSGALYVRLRRKREG